MENSRELRFRAWDETNKIMWHTGVEGQSIGQWTFTMYFDPSSGNLKAIVYGDDFMVTDDPFPMYDSYKKELPIMQYTGLCDKNGKGIYEGDVIACGDGNVPTEIKWHEESHAYYAYNLKRKEHHRLDKFFERYIGEVIGNIYQNPELLEV